jgi:hypothetical protein
VPSISITLSEAFTSLTTAALPPQHKDNAGDILNPGRPVCLDAGEWGLSEKTFSAILAAESVLGFFRYTTLASLPVLECARHKQILERCLILLQLQR